MLEGQYLTLVGKAEQLKAANEAVHRSLEQLRDSGLHEGLEGLRSSAQALGPGLYGWTVNQALSEAPVECAESCGLEALSIRLYAALQELGQRLVPSGEKRAPSLARKTTRKWPLDTPLCRLFLQPTAKASDTAGELVAEANICLRGKVRALLGSLAQALSALQGSSRELTRTKTEASAQYTDSTEDLSESYRRLSPPRARVLPSPRRFASAPRAPCLTADECELQEVSLLQSFRVSRKRPSLSVCSLRPSQPSKSTTDIRALQQGLAKLRKRELAASRQSASKEVSFPFLRPF